MFEPSNVKHVPVEIEIYLLFKHRLPKKTKEQAMDSSSLEQQIPVFMSQNPELMAQLPGNITKSTNYNHKSQNRIKCKNFQIF